MESLSLFTEALGLRDPWRVEACDLDAANGKLTLRLGWERGSRFPAKDGDGELYPVHDSEEREWRHLNFFQFETRLVARLPRVRDGEGRVVTAEVPWARSGSGFTLLMEALVMQLCKEMPVAAAARIVGEHDTRIWRVVHHYVGKAHAAESREEVATVGIDEIATRKGHRYGTCFAEIRPDGTGRLLHLAPGKDAATVAGFAEELGKHGASPEQIGRVAIDMSRAYIAGVRDHLPEAETSFDRFHVMVHAGRAVDEVRKEVAREHGGLGKGSLWSLRGNAERLRPEARALREELSVRYAELGRALALREFLRDTWRYTAREDAEDHLRRFCAWAQRSRLQPFVKLARTIRAHWAGILGYYPDYLTSGAMESINAKLALARRRARGFRNFGNFRAIAYWIAGDLRPFPDFNPK